jgi:hypothetical protein
MIRLAMRSSPQAVAWAAAQALTPVVHKRGRRDEIRRDAAPQMMVKQIPLDGVIDGVTLLEERRAQKAPDLRPMLADNGQGDAAFGEVLLKLESEPGIQRQFSVAFRALDLRRDEIVVLTLTWLSGGMLEGGYTVVLANPDWFKNAGRNDNPDMRRNFQNADTGGNMEREQKSDMGDKRRDDYTLMELVIDHNPEARATHELARQLAPMLPIKSLDHLAEQMKSLKLSGLSVPVAMFGDQIAPEVFPIEDPRDLIWKLSGAVRIGMVEGKAHASVLSTDTAVLLARMSETVPGRRAPIPSGYFTGPSMFGTAPKREG